MTREEAIYRLKNTAWLGTDKERAETEQAVDMAIEALQFAEHFDLLKEFQSLQEVVRCKDCKRQKTCKFAQWQGNYGYCSNGERRE